jgi:riboflavin biosynthesis pyrimidine reductase
VRDLKAQSTQDISIEGPNLAAQAIRMGLVDVYELLVGPVMLGGGKRVLPDGVRERLELMEERRFGNGWVLLRYRRNQA